MFCSYKIFRFISTVYKKENPQFIPILFVLMVRNGVSCSPQHIPEWLVRKHKGRLQTPPHWSSGITDGHPTSWEFWNYKYTPHLMGVLGSQTHTPLHRSSGITSVHPTLWDFWGYRCTPQLIGVLEIQTYIPPYGSSGITSLHSTSWEF